MSFFNIEIPSGTINADDIASNANIDGDKFSTNIPIIYSQATGADVASETATVYTARKAGSFRTLQVFPDTAPTGGDKQFTVDLKKSTGAGAFATVLSAVVTVDNTSVDLTVQSGAFSTSTYLAGDSFQVVVTASGSTGSQGQGVNVTLHVKEDST